ncbi:MAG: hypothetical protein ACP5UN_00950 [Candidatus Micrarchaeia archaeon]
MNKIKQNKKEQLTKNISNKAMFLIFTISALSSLIAIVGASSISQINCTILNIYYIVNEAIFIVGLTLMLLGGALYAGAHIMPGQSKGVLQGYGMGMILGGVIGVILAQMAPYIFNIITGNTINAYTSGCSTLSSPGSGGGGSGGGGSGGGGSGGGGGGGISTCTTVNSCMECTVGEICEFNKYTYKCCSRAGGTT